MAVQETPGAVATTNPLALDVPDGFVALKLRGAVILVPEGTQVSVDGRTHVAAVSLTHGDAIAGIWNPTTRTVSAEPSVMSQYGVLNEEGEPLNTGPAGQTPTAAPATLPASAPSSGGSGTTTTTTTTTGAPPTTGFAGVPPGGKLWRVDGKVFWGREIKDPDTGEVVGFAGWHITTTADLDTLLAGGGLEFAFDGTLGQAEAQGFVNGGVLSEVQGSPEEDPLENFYEDWAEQLSLSPMYDDPAILELAIIAAVEGREITANELSQTDWWRGSTDAQRAWGELVSSNPAQAALIQDNNREDIRARFWSMGYTDVPDSLVDYVADQWTSGVVSQADAYRQVQRETDPYAPGASPYAGLDLDELGWSVVRDRNGELYFSTEDGYFLIDGPGGRARYEDMATDMLQAPEGRFVSLGGQEYFVTADDQWYLATGPGQAAGLRALYGEPEVIDHYERGSPALAGTVVELFGGAGGIERYTAGDVASAGSAADLAKGAERLDTTALGEEERVREMLRQYVGPYHAANYTDAWVAQWAGRLRNGGPGEIDLLVQDLQRDFQALFPGYDGNNLSYESVAGSARGLWERWSGNEVDEENANWLSFLGQGPDAVNREGWLRTQGLREGWAPVEGEATRALQVLGSNVVRSVV